MRYLYRIMLIVFVSGFYMAGNAQDFSTIPDSGISYYEPIQAYTWFNIPPERFIHGLKVKDIRLEDADSIFVFHKEGIKDGVESWDYTVGPSWLGKKVIKRSSNEEVYYNLQDEEILIKPHAVKNEKWIMWMNNKGDSAIARVVDIYEMDFLNIKDTVKEIRIDFYNNSETLNPEQGNNILKISKNYGWLQVINFREFPDSNPYEELKTFVLAGNTLEKIGLQALKLKDVFSFEVGDVFHIRTNTKVYDASNNQYLYTRRSNDIREITNTQYDSTYKNFCWRYENPLVEISANNKSFNESTGILECIDNWDKPVEYEFLERIYNKGRQQLPMEETGEHFSYANYLMFRNENFNKRIQYLFFPEPMIENPFPPYKKSVQTSGPSFYKVINGIGDLRSHHWWEGGGETYHSYEELHYYNLGDEEWGNPLKVDNQIVDKQIKVYPNPAKESICISGIKQNKSFHIYIFNAQGSHVSRPTEHSTLDISFLPPGLYFIKINQEGVYFRGKFLKLE